jgi:hypothetical protein
MNNILDIFKGSAPQLYKKLETKISDGQVRDSGSVYSNSSRRSSYRSEGGYNKRGSYRSEGDYDDRRGSYRSNISGGDAVKEFSSKHTYEDDMHFDLNGFLILKDSNEDRNKLIKEYIKEFKNKGIPPSFRNGMFYLAAIDSAITRNRLCDDDDPGVDNNTCVQKKDELTKLGVDLFKRLKDQYKSRGQDGIDVLLEDAPELSQIINGKILTKQKRYSRSKGGYNNYRNSYDDRRGSYRSEGGYNDRRGSYRSEGGYNDRRESYSSFGGDSVLEEVKTNSMSIDSSVRSKGYAKYFANEEGAVDRVKLYNKFFNMSANETKELKSSLSNISIYMSALNGQYVNSSDDKEKAKIYIAFKKLYDELIKNKSLDSNEITKQFKEEAPALFHRIKNAGHRHNGGYDDRDYSYRSEGGYDDRDYSYRSNRGGMHYDGGGRYNDDSYYNNRGGRYEEDDYDGGNYYSDNMHGGALGEFRNEIGRNLLNNQDNKLRDNILNIEL